MAAPRHMTDHTLDTIKNSITNPYHLDFSAKLSSGVTVSPVYAGRVVHLDSNGEFVLGLADVARAGHMPIFLWQSSDDFDVLNDGEPGSAQGWSATSPTGVLTGLVATGGYELETTEFDTSDSYSPGDCLTAPDETAAQAGGNKANAGRLEKATAFNKPVCGIVSRGVKTNAHGKSCLYFWSYFLPKY